MAVLKPAFIDCKMIWPTDNKLFVNVDFKDKKKKHTHERLSF